MTFTLKSTLQLLTISKCFWIAFILLIFQGPLSFAQDNKRYLALVLVNIDEKPDEIGRAHV